MKTEYLNAITDKMILLLFLKHLYKRLRLIIILLIML